MMIQADMIAYREPGEPPQLGLPEMYVSLSVIRNANHRTQRFDSIGTPEATQLVANISTIYAPELVVGFTPVRLRFIIMHEPKVDTSVVGMLQ